MGIKEDLLSTVKQIFKEGWTDRDGIKVPESEDIKLANDAVRIDGTVLYADLAESTNMVDHYEPEFAAEIYKAYLHCAAKIIRYKEGVITAYDGDRVMAVFTGSSKNTAATRCALGINHAVSQIIGPSLKECYPKSKFTLKHVIGIDTSPLLAARTGIRGANDLVWVGRAANYAAKLTSLPPSYSTRITKDVYDCINKSVKYSNGESMWEHVTWTKMGDMSIYRSNWYWGF